jgi:hypothetical protein
MTEQERPIVHQDYKKLSSGSHGGIVNVAGNLASRVIGVLVGIETSQKDSDVKTFRSHSEKSGGEWVIFHLNCLLVLHG